MDAENRRRDGRGGKPGRYVLLRPSAGSVPECGVYIASKSKHASEWLALRESGVPVVSSWIDEAGPGQTADPEDLWKRVEREIAGADGLILVTREGDGPLHGALVEVGIAIGYGVPVIVIDEGLTAAKPCGFTHHPLVSVATSVDEALRLILLPPYPPIARGR